MKKLSHKILVGLIPFISASAYTITAGTDEEPFIISAKVEKGRAKIKIVGYINEWSKASSRELEKQIDELIAKGHNDADIYMNSRGGSTIEAVEIMNVLRKFKGKLIAHGGAIVASAMSYIAVMCDEFHVAANTQFMYHRPSGFFGGNYDEITSSLVLLKNTEADYVDAYAAKSKLSKEEIIANWSKGDQWLMGKEIVSEGFADKLTKVEVPISAKDVTTIEACGAPVIPKITVKSLNQNKVERTELIASLGLNENATDADINAKIAQNKTDAEAFAKSKGDREAAEAKAQKDKVNALVDAAIKDKKITADVKDNYIKLATADFESTEATLRALTAPEKPNPNTPNAHTDGRDKWTFADYQSKDPEAYVALLESDPEAAAKLENEHYK